MNADDLRSIIGTYAEPAEKHHVLVVSSRSADDFVPPDNVRIDWHGEVRRANDLAGAPRAGLGILFDQVRRMTPREVVLLLSSLRDRYCRRVVVAEPDLELGDRRLLALGYIRQETAVAGRPVYLYDPGAFFERREWNTPEYWAHPEAFDKRRW